MTAILAITEQRDGALRKVSHEVVAAARQLAGGGTVDALVFGTAAVSGAESLAANRVLAAENQDFGRYNPYIGRAHD